jgi:copper resistance protein B
MKKYASIIFLLSPLWGGVVYAGAMHEPLISMVKIDQLEYQKNDDQSPMVWDAYAWAGYDLDKIWIKTEGERVDGRTEASEFQLLYSRAITAFWDVQVGWRHDAQPRPNRDWAVITLHGLAPYFLETDAELFVGDSGRSQARLKVEYEYLFSQRLVLSPKIELTVNGYNDEQRGEGSGLSATEAGVRLRYEIRREFAPYLGINWRKKFGATADYARDEDERSAQWVAGIRAWY